MGMDFDMAETIKAKSDQLNAADLVGGPITVQITGGRLTRDQKQPVIFNISGGHMPWKPCKTMRRLLVEIAGTSNAGFWQDKWVQLYCDPSVTYGSDKVGGIRVGGVSCIDKPREITLMTRRNQYTKYTVKPLKAGQQGNATADLGALLEELGFTLDAVDRWHQGFNKPAISSFDDKGKADFAAWLGSGSSDAETAKQQIRELMAADDE